MICRDLDIFAAAFAEAVAPHLATALLLALGAWGRVARWWERECI